MVAVGADPPDDEALRHKARRLADDLKIPELSPGSYDGITFFLAVTPRRLELRVTGGDVNLRGGRPLYVNALRRDVISRAGARLNQPLLRAVGVRRRKQLEADVPRIVDATAGWGGDALMLASLGCSVLAVERHPVVAALLEDGIHRAPPALGRRCAVTAGDACDLFRRLGAAPHDAMTPWPDGWAAFAPPDVIYLDPMFPSRRGHAAESKSMRVLRRLTGPDDDGPALLAAARDVAPPRIVVKRPLHAEAISTESPDATYRGKAMRYDVYFQAHAR